MMKPIECWHCGQLMGDDIKGNATVMQSTDMPYDEICKVMDEKAFAIDRKCPRCKKFNLITNK